MPKIHHSITINRIVEACERRQLSLDNPGFCIKCGADADDCEPDARKYECVECGEKQVYGSDELAIMLF